ncbi:hemolysin family protein [Paenibacillus sp. YYML68]|uniref:hemolysin family protein n=1 Tax=Paenibacillus sp. YYML68 TaxID=2909250 RepID=UPI002492DF9D|nr:hemolysin family protein [Paenibacillus sp. YYML68]
MLTEILILLVLIVLNAFFAASEIALISLNDNKIKAMAEEGHKKAKLLQNLLSEPSRFLATIQIGITLAGFLASAFAAESFAGRLAQFLHSANVPLPIATLELISVILITLLLSYFTLVLGELVPKRLALQKAEPIAMFAATPLTLLSKISSPFVKLLTFSMNALVRLAGVDPNEKKDEVTEEEIRMMVEVGNENGAIQETERLMINNIFDFDNKTVSDIMTHRSNVVGIPVNISLNEVIRLINIEKYTRLPVYEGSIDTVVGILHVKDLLDYIEHGGESELEVRNISRPPYFVPTSKKIDLLFKELQKNKVHMAIAIDEYGGTAGIVTIEDVLEEIVGNIFDEHDEDDKEIEKLDANTYMVSGIVNLRDLRNQLHISFPYEEYDTLNGFLIGQLGRIPLRGEHPVIEYEGVVFRVEEVDERRITKVKIGITEEPVEV